MTRDKARELFSEHAEGALSAGLKLAFERALERDPSLKAEYVHFQSVLVALEDGSGRTVETPSWLHERIMARIDKAEWEAKHNRRTGAWSSLRLAVLGGAAALALIGAVLAWLPGGNISLAGVFGAPVAPPKDDASRTDHAPEFTPQDGRLRITRESGADVAYSVTRTADGAVIAEGRTGDRKMELSVTNEDETARLVQVRIGQVAKLIALPGKAPRPMTEGRGNVRDLALALADTFTVPVEIDTMAPDTVSWTITGGDAASVSVAPPTVTVQRSESGMILVGN
jgi:hypothetical protein